jgi:hypothetical protein
MCSIFSTLPLALARVKGKRQRRKNAEVKQRGEKASTMLAAWIVRAAMDENATVLDGA